MKLRLLTAVLVALVCADGTVAGQNRTAGRARVGVTIALVDRLPQPGAPYLIVRNPAPTGDVILIPSTADASVLSEAITLLLTAREAAGDSAVAPAVLRARPGGSGAPRREIPWSRRVLADLLRVPRQTIDGIGNVPAVRIWLPASNPRAHRRSPA